ncbi:MAG: replication initiation protein [Nocardioides sp.]|nr:replication initiation protein [Nocardioides sp.]
MNTLDTSSGAPSTVSGFSGFGEGAPLDLSNLTPAAESGVVARLLDGSFSEWADAAAAVSNCARPVRLVGSSTTVDVRTGEILGTFSSDQAPLGVLHRACGNRRAQVCPSCSRVYARDTFELIRAGVAGGKTVSPTVGDNPLLFATFTAPSFGHVHGTRPHNGMPTGGRCRPRDRAQACTHGIPIGCMRVHGEDDPANGSPICWDCYDWHSAVVWQWWAPELWRRTTIALRRELATRLGVKECALRDHASLQFAKVAEYQARGLVHFHALIRLDGPDGPGSPAPLEGRELADAVNDAAGSVAVTVPGIDEDDVARRLGWGQQLDVRVVRAGRRTDEVSRALAPEQVAGYLAKYATKDANSIRGPGQARPHLTRLTSTCRDLSTRSAERYGYGVDAKGKPLNPYLLLNKWAHMLGFRGHFSSKSRRYSVTLGQLRRARQRFQALVAESNRTGEPLDLRDLEARLLADDEDTTLVVGSWAYQGTGWANPGDEALALAAAARAREYDQWRAEQRKTA